MHDRVAICGVLVCVGVWGGYDFVGCDCRVECSVLEMCPMVTLYFMSHAFQSLRIRKDKKETAKDRSARMHTGALLDWLGKISQDTTCCSSDQSGLLRGTATRHTSSSAPLPPSSSAAAALSSSERLRVSLRGAATG